MKRWSFVRLVVLFSSVPAFLSCEDTGGGGTPAPLQAALTGTQAADDTHGPVWVLMKDHHTPVVAAATRLDWRALGRDVVGQLTARADASQGSLRSWLTARGITFHSFWIANALKLTADKATLTEIARRPDVDRVLPDRVYSLPPIRKAAAIPRPRTTEWGLDNIHAPQVWSTFGVRGENIVVGSIDTGAQFDHPALVNQYRGNQNGSFDHNFNWFDPTGTCTSTPCDDVGHGTHTMGTMVGDDGDPGGNQVGVAPHARWITAKACQVFGCPLEALMSSAQWLMAPTDLAGQNPSPDRRAHVVNNSWGGSSGDPFFQQIVQSWIAAGMFPAFANGNNGPSCGTATSPGDYPESYGVAAYDIANAIAGFSGRGPSAMGGMVKPNIAAPGVSVRSSVPGNDYDVFSGTSMATPHLAGTVALMWSAAPSLFGQIDATRAILDATAVDTPDLSCGGTPQNNNVFGEGRLDAFAAVDGSPRGPSGTLQGTVTGAGGAPLAGALVKIEGPTNRTTRTDASGAYSVVLSVGSYRVTASAFGYVAQTVEGVTISEGATTTQDFALTVAPSFALAGQVRDAAGAPLPGARVTILGTPLPPAVTDASGRYSFASVPAGSYDVRAESGHCYDGVTSPLVLNSDATLDFTLTLRKDAFGHFCQLQPAQFIDAQTVVPLIGDDAATSVPLPFTFTFYGQSYDSVSITTNGFISFLPQQFPPYFNTQIPDPFQPNAAIYALWDDLVVDSSASVRTQLLGDAPNRRFVIEWRDVFFLENGQRARFEIVLHENGRVLLQYAPPTDNPGQRGSSATVGLENETGTVAFSYSYNEDALDAASAILFQIPPSGFVQGAVTDANDGQPISGAEVRALQNGAVVRAARTNAQGRYRLQLPVGSYLIETGPTNYPTRQQPVTVALDQTVTVDFALPTARAEVKPATLSLVVPTDQVRTRALTLTNTGSLDLTFQINEAGGQRQLTIATARLPRDPSADPNAPTTRALFVPGPKIAGWAPSAAGNVVRSFVPAGVGQAWGIGLASNLWVSDSGGAPMPPPPPPPPPPFPPDGGFPPPPPPPPFPPPDAGGPNRPPTIQALNHNHEFTLAGAATGRDWAAPWAGAFPADMAYLPARGLVCQLAVGGDNGIHCWNPNTGAEEDSITGSLPWTATSQRGLAYRPDDDSFYVGGWNEGTVYHIKGLSRPDKGAVIGQCKPADGNISGLAWNGSMEVLWAATNSPSDSIYELDPTDCTVLSVLPHPSPGFNGAGLELDPSGDLWVVGRGVNTVYLVESGVPAFSDVPWLSVAPATGTVAPGGKRTLTVTVNTTGLQAGTYLASIFVSSNSGRQAQLRIPVSLVVTGYQQGVNAGGSSYKDKLGDTWAADQRHQNGSWGYIQKSSTRSTSHDIDGTTDPKLFQSQRVDPYAYRFDSVPNGVYQVDLRFAELDKVQPGGRLFDVITENTLQLPAHDIFYEVGRFAADDHTFFVEVTDGRMDIRLIPRAGSAKPVINALRITHRPDR